MPPVRILLDDVPHEGTWNMAVDEALLDSGIDGDEVRLRWYAWSQPTISVGYFQAVPDFADDDPFSGLRLVRRLSGGGAILHHHEWTYSCVLPASHPLANRPTELYTAVHQAMINVLNSLGAHAQLRGERIKQDEKNIFLCFLRGDPRDVVLAGHKVVGSAQRRRGGAVLQHGSLLLRTSPYAPQQPGLRDLADIPLSDSELRHRLAQSVACRLAGTTVEQRPEDFIEYTTLSALELASAKKLVDERYAHLDWKAK